VVMAAFASTQPHKATIGNPSIYLESLPRT
jgi:hypothetical protein